MSQQDFISIGLDVSGFSADKKKKLNEFIALFEKLSKYDGMKVTPVLGEGLTKFNKSLAETRYLLDDINYSIKKLNGLKLTPKVEVPKKEFNEITNEVKKMNLGIEGIGKGLTRGLSLLRSIAYILPGIGIAGIFDVAEKAIVNAVHGLGFFVDKEEVAYQKTQLLNAAFKDLNELFKDVAKNSQYASDEIVKAFESQSLVDKVRGLSEGKLLKEALANTTFGLANNQIGKSANPEETLGYVNDELYQSQIRLQGFKAKMSQIVVNAEKAIDLIEKDKRIPNDVVRAEFEEKVSKKAALQTERVKLEADKEKEIYENLKNVRDKYISLRQKQDEQKAAIDKYNSDQERKLEVETEKEIIATSLNANKIKLNDDRNLYNAQISFIEEKKRKEIEAANQTLKGVIGDEKNPNLQFDKDTAEYKIAVQKNGEEIKRINQETKAALEKNEIEFYQRRLKALTEIDKDEIDKSAIKAEKVANNEEHSLVERLAAYNAYLAGKQLLEDREFSIGIQRGAKEYGGKTSLTEEEKLRLNSDRLTKQYNLQADAEKKVYEIVYSSLKKELDTVLNFNHEVDDANKAAYAKELRDNNARFANKIFQYKAFKANYDAINKKYGVILSEDDNEKQNKSDIQSALIEVDSLKNRRIEAEKEVAAAKEQLDLSNAAHPHGNASDREVLEANKLYDEALGKRDAFDRAILDAEKKLQAAQKKGDDDEIKNAKAKYEQLIQFEKEYAENKKRIEEGLFNLIKTAIDAETEHRLEVLALQKETRDEGYDSEISAIEKSSLTAKDKASLDIQLNEQKLEYDKAVALQERKLKQDAAIADRELAVAHIVWNTAEGVSQALTYPPPADAILAAQRAILGGIEIATVLAQPIPSYAEGTPLGGHPGGPARYGEAGWEVVKEPYKSPYLVTDEHVSYLPEGTEIIPFKEANIGSNVSRSDEMAPFRWLAKQLNKNKPVVKTTNIIKVDLGNELYKNRILGKS